MEMEGGKIVVVARSPWKRAVTRNLQQGQGTARIREQKRTTAHMARRGEERRIRLWLNDVVLKLRWNGVSWRWKGTCRCSVRKR